MTVLCHCEPKISELVPMFWVWQSIPASVSRLECVSGKRKPKMLVRIAASARKVFVSCAFFVGGLAMTGLDEIAASARNFVVS